MNFVFFLIGGFFYNFLSCNNLMKKSFNPSEYDINTYIKVLDKDQDGKVTLSDVEGMIVKLMCHDHKSY